MNAVMPILNVDGHDFYYLERDGPGPTILMLCSTGLDSRQWSAFLPMVGPRRVICPHYLSYPKSGEWAGQGEIDSSIDYLACSELLAKEEGKVDILGHSYGGFIGLRLCEEFPDSVRRVAIHEPTVWGCLHHTQRDDLKNEFGEVVETFFTEGLAMEDFLEDFVDYWNVPGTWKSMPEHRKDMWRGLHRKILSEVRLLCYDRTPPSFYQSIGHPTLITLSPETPPHQFEACTILTASMTNVEVEEVPGGHMGVVTMPEVIMPILAKWLSK